MSHYVKVNACGVPVTVAQDAAYDEIVIPQESQIAPAFILHLERSNFKDIAIGWDRICQRSVDFGMCSFLFSLFFSLSLFLYFFLFFFPFHLLLFIS
jgi:hypothetical protein